MRAGIVAWTGKTHCVVTPWLDHAGPIKTIKNTNNFSILTGSRGQATG
ncbi:MAG TPA: hypothetical protein LFV92_03130 [Rickettsia endosymbiont of Ceroptres masudai]|nr:hypothetical protein [Rickettsia endosymbiont of Ceroptres masudai]